MKIHPMAPGLFSTLVLVCSALAMPLAAMAQSAPVKPQAKFDQECGACHIAFPPGMMPAASWQHIMDGLHRHFGTDATLDPQTAQEIGTWLQAHAGTFRRVSEPPPGDRITRTAWFVRQHREGEIPAAVWKRASVGSPSNCAACHPGAARGDFDEDRVRIPK
jgi:hypothetical protein